MFQSSRIFQSVPRFLLRISLSNRTLVGKPKGFSRTLAKYEINFQNRSGLPNIHKPFIVLGIETSCDDTGVAIVRSDGTILSNVLISQFHIHERFGGIVPTLARDAHSSNIDRAVSEALLQANITLDDVDGISATRGPGLEPCLYVGYKKAIQLAAQFSKPFCAINHLEAHCLSARLAGEILGNSPFNPISHSQDPSGFTSKIQFPFLALLASGGHTILLIVKNIGEYDVLGGTLDDALGEAFDKVARILGLRTGGFGGKAVEESAKQANSFPKINSIPLRGKKNCDFSFSGLKTRFRLEVEKVRKECGIELSGSNAPLSDHNEVQDLITLPSEATSNLAFHFQHVAFSHIEDRIGLALKYVEMKQLKINGLVIVGGVASNTELRRRLCVYLQQKHAHRPIPIVCPPISLCSDNGVIVAWNGIEKFRLGISDSIHDLSVFPRWPLGELIPNLESDLKTSKKKLFNRTRRLLIPNNFDIPA